MHRNSCFNKFMKISYLNIKKKITSSNLEENFQKNPPKSTNINVLLNRVKLDQKNESIKKIYFSAVASAGLLVFGFIIF